MKFKFAKDVKESTERKESRSLAFVLFLIIIMCCAWIAPSYLYADPPITIPGSTIPPELRKQEQPTKKPPLPSQMYGLSPDPAKVLHLPPIDVDALIAEDKTASKGKPPRLGVHREVDASPLTDGEWWDVGKGSIWLLEIHARTATGLDIHFTNFYIPKGAKVFVYSPSAPDQYAGPYRIEGPDFWSQIVGGNRVIIELAIPSPFDRSNKPFVIKEIGHMYYPFEKNDSSKLNISPLTGTCHNDAACSQYSAWALDSDTGLLKEQNIVILAERTPCLPVHQTVKTPALSGFEISGNTIKSLSIERRWWIRP